MNGKMKLTLTYRIENEQITCVIGRDLEKDVGGKHKEWDTMFKCRAYRDDSSFGNGLTASESS